MEVNAGLTEKKKKKKKVLMGGNSRNNKKKLSALSLKAPNQVARWLKCFKNTRLLVRHLDWAHKHAYN